MTLTFQVCTHELDARDVHGVERARQLLADIRERVRAQRASQPQAAHYVNVMVCAPVDEVVQRELLSKLGDGDGIDSVAVAAVDFSASDASRWLARASPPH